MSDPGLYRQLYSQLRDCAELIDRVIIGLETRSLPLATEDREVLTELLRALQSAPSSSMRAVLLSNVLREKRSSSGTANWSEVADAIDRGEASDAIIGRLEILARALESERADMHARIHGANAR